MSREYYGEVTFDYDEDEYGETVEQAIINDTKYIDIEYFARIKADLEAKLAESEKKLNQYPYKNEVIEEQYEDLKNGIKFRIKNNINDDLEQHYHCIDVLCEKHKARIRDIENSISAIDQLKQQLAEKEEQIKMLEEHKFYADNIIQAYADKCKNYEQQLAEKEKEILDTEEKWIKWGKQDKISFCIEQLEKVKKFVIRQLFITTKDCSDLDKAEAKGCNELREETIKEIDNQIEELKKEMK